MRSTLFVFILMSGFTFGQVLVLEPPKVELPSVEKPKGTYFDFDAYVDATFLGGVIALKQYLQGYDLNKTLNWADSSFNKRGYYAFIVEVDGSTSQIEVLRGISPEADSLAFELISIMPQWSPGENGQGAVRTHVRLPIVFSKEEK